MSYDPRNLWPKRCACGRAFTREQWARLPLVGTYDDGTDVLEMRNCVCRSTISIYVGKPKKRAPKSAPQPQPAQQVWLESCRDPDCTTCMAPRIVAAVDRVLREHQDRNARRELARLNRLVAGMEDTDATLDRAIRATRVADRAVWNHIARTYLGATEEPST